MDFFERYVRLWSPAIKPPGERLMQRLPLSDARVIFDLGAGTGNLLPTLRRAAGPGAFIVAVDRSVRMLTASTILEPRCVMDLGALALAPGSCDVAVLSFVIFQLPDPAATLADVGRLLRTGGGIGLTSWKRTEQKDQSVWEDALRAAGVAIEERPPGYDHLTDTPEKVEALLRGARFTPTDVWVEEHTHRWEPDELFELGVWTFRRELASIDGDERAGLRERVRARLAETIPDGVALDSEVIFAVATRR